MKKLLLSLPLLAFLAAACSNEFDVAAPWKEIPVVYAVLSPKDTAHYIRVEKAFLDPEKSALEIAQIADSLYYPENAITVLLKRLKTGEEFQLHRVDGTLEGYPREGGIFAAQPNYLYKIKPAELGGGLQKGETYRVVIKRADSKPDVTAETTIPRDFYFDTPDPGQLPPKIAFSDSLSTDIIWFGDPNTRLFNVIFRIRYREENAAGALIGRDTLSWTALKNIRPGTFTVNTPQGVYLISEEKIVRESFFRFLSENIDTSSVRIRRFEGLDITLVGGGKEIDEYLLTAQANAGLTGAEVLINYTNMSEGYGVFTARNTGHLNNILILNSTVDAMRKNPLTNRLNFQK